MDQALRSGLRDEDEATGLFDSPRSGTTTPKDQPSATQTLPFRSATTRSTQMDAATREKRLQAELAQLRQMNSTIETLNQSLTTAKANLSTMQTNMTSAKALLKTWTRILNQAEHNQRLILDPNWPGATQDLRDIEDEEARRHDAAQQKIQEEARRREEAERKREEDARRREESERSRGRGLGRTRSTRGSAASRGASTTLSSRGRGTASTRGGTSGIARGVPARGRGRG